MRRITDISYSDDAVPAAACPALPSCGDLLEQQTYNISYSSKMDWAQVSILFGVASFAAIVLFVMYRKPHT
jgi:hypothetical protein